ncbi:helix-turn-helix domain-containing protein [Aquincola tertiaricarbonis]|uniref:helix-turn-helix domain-containing protein n=1 Tax=Aquincola tertiaricarbonis TaxID=391953 RepID=UPI000614E7E4|nr:AraC family transcriptional regulator [Aquincola tertiaricarbonis]
MSDHPELPENLLNFTRKSRIWNSVRVDLVEYDCAGRVVHEIGNKEDTRLGVILDEIGRGRCEPRLAADKPCPVAYKPRHMHFAPAGLPVWGYTDDSRFVRAVNLNFDAGALHERLQIAHEGRTASEPRMRFTDDRIWALVKLLADVVDDPDPSAQLYGDSLVAAIAARLFTPRPTVQKGRTRLSPLQLRDAIEYMNARLPTRVDLETLAALAGLSQSHYSRAFKASTGLAPYQWQLQARVETAKNLLFHTRGSLEDVASATGFADAVHFGRTFRRMTGATPAVWRADRLR